MTQTAEYQIDRSTTIAELEAMHPQEGTIVYLDAGGRSGNLRGTTTDISTEVTADTQQGIYIAAFGDATGASGGWVRQYSGPINILWFGDASAGNTALTGAVTHASTLGGGEVYLPAGQYDIGDGTSFIGDEFSNITIYGDGYGTQLLRTVNGANNGIAGMKFAGDSVYSLTGLTIRDLRITGNSASLDKARGVLLSNVSGVAITRVHVDTIAGEGINANGSNLCEKITVDGCFATNVGNSIYSAYNINAKDSHIINNKADNCGMGIETQGERVVMTGNIFRDIADKGILFFSTWSGYTDQAAMEVNTDVNTIANNQFIDVKLGLFIGDVEGHTTFDGSSGKVIISNNIFIRCQQMYFGGVDTAVTHAGGVVIDGNYCFDAKNANSYCIHHMKGRAVIQNNVFEKGPTSVWARGIYCARSDRETQLGVTGEDNYHAIQNNTFISNCVTSHFIQCGRLATVVGNQVNKAEDIGAWVVYDIGNKPLRLTHISEIYSPETVFSVETKKKCKSSTTPAEGTWEIGDIIEDTAPTAGGTIGWVCTTAGTAGTISPAITGSITTGTDQLTVSALEDLFEGDYITIAGVTGVKQVLSISGLVVTIDSNADATVSGAAVTWSAPTWKTYGTIAA